MESNTVTDKNGKIKRIGLLKRFQSNWNYIINMGNSKLKEQESLLALTSRDFWCTDNVALNGSTIMAKDRN